MYSRPVGGPTPCGQGTTLESVSANYLMPVHDTDQSARVLVGHPRYVVAGRVIAGNEDVKIRREVPQLYILF